MQLVSSKLQEMILAVQKFTKFMSHKCPLILDGQPEKNEGRFLEMLSYHNFNPSQHKQDVLCYVKSRFCCLS